MNIQILSRIFKFSHGHEEQVLQDPNPDMSPQEVLYHYAALYPELASGTVSNATIENDTQVFRFTTGSVGVKG